MAAEASGRSRSRSRSPHGATEVGYRSYIGSADFEAWAMENLPDIANKVVELNRAFKRCRRFTNFLKNKMLEGLDPEAPQFRSEYGRFDQKLKPYALMMAKKEVAKEQSKNEKAERKEKRAKRHEETHDLIQFQSKQIAELTTQVEAMKTETSAMTKFEAMKTEKSVTTQVECALALPSSSSAPLDMALKSVQDAKDKCIEQEDIAIALVVSLEAKKKDLQRKKATMEKNMAQLTAAARTVPTIKKQLEVLKIELSQKAQEYAKLEVELIKAKDNVKTTRVEVKKLEKEEKNMQDVVHRHLAETAQDDSESEQATEMLDEVFKLMDRTCSDKVNKRDFIKALEHEKVASFFDLPSKILAEDGSRDKMEAVFQKIATNGNEFDIDELKAVYGEIQKEAYGVTLKLLFPLNSK